MANTYRKLGDGWYFSSNYWFLLRRRLREVALLLHTTNLSVLEAALEAGFGDLSHFNHTFRAAFGSTPTKWRRKTR
jgi:AraC family transcriptional regulator